MQGYIFRRSDGVYQMVLTIRGAFADIFWFSLFHELGHIVNGDIGKSIKFIDDGSDVDKETAADLFARDRLLSPESYASFIQKGDFTFEAICRSFSPIRRPASMEMAAAAVTTPMPPI